MLIVSKESINQHQIDITQRKRNNEQGKKMTVDRITQRFLILLMYLLSIKSCLLRTNVKE